MTTTIAANTDAQRCCACVNGNETSQIAIKQTCRREIAVTRRCRALMEMKLHKQHQINISTRARCEMPMALPSRKLTGGQNPVGANRHVRVPWAYAFSDAPRQIRRSVGPARRRATHRRPGKRPPDPPVGALLRQKAQALIQTTPPRSRQGSLTGCPCTGHRRCLHAGEARSRDKRQLNTLIDLAGQDGSWPDVFMPIPVYSAN